MISAITIAPGSTAPERLTVTFCRVRPRRSLPSRLVPSTRTSARRPTHARRAARACRCVSSMRRSTRARRTSAGTWPGSAAAAVPERGEKTNVNAASNAASRTRAMVASKSSSVSPGNPAMRSVVMLTSGTAARRARTRSRYAAAV